MSPIQPESQQARILEMLRVGPVTPLMAWVEEGVYRVADPVEKLRKRGYVIGMSMQDMITTRGKRVSFARYVLVGEPRGKHER